MYRTTVVRDIILFIQRKYRKRQRIVYIRTGQCYVIRIRDAHTVLGPTPVPTKVLRPLHLFHYEHVSGSGRRRGRVP